MHLVLPLAPFSSDVLPNQILGASSPVLDFEGTRLSLEDPYEVLPEWHHCLVLDILVVSFYSLGCHLELCCPNSYCPSNLDVLGFLLRCDALVGVRFLCSWG